MPRIKQNNPKHLKQSDKLEVSDEKLHNVGKLRKYHFV